VGQTATLPTSARRNGEVARGLNGETPSDLPTSLTASELACRELIAYRSACGEGEVEGMPRLWYEYRKGGISILTWKTINKNQNMAVRGHTRGARAAFATSLPARQTRH
jgi:hypothetical protein